MNPVLDRFYGAPLPVNRQEFWRRDGFALMATLWIVVAIAAVTFSMAESAHLLMNGARNRTNARIAAWRAIGCLARIRASLAEDSATTSRARMVWDSLDTYAVAQDDGCVDTALADGTTMDVNHVSARGISTTLNAAGADPAMIHGVIALTVAGGHRPYGSEEELEAITGAAMRRAGANGLFGVDTGRVILGRAPRPVRIGVLADMLADGTLSSGDVSALPSLPSLRDSAAHTVISPDAWWLRIEATHGDPPVTVRLEAHVVLIGGSVGVEDVRLR